MRDLFCFTVLTSKAGGGPTVIGDGEVAGGGVEACVLLPVRLFVSPLLPTARKRPRSTAQVSALASGRSTTVQTGAQSTTISSNRAISKDKLLYGERGKRRQVTPNPVQELRFDRSRATCLASRLPQSGLLFSGRNKSSRLATAALAISGALSRLRKSRTQSRLSYTEGRSAMSATRCPGLESVSRRS